MMTPDVHRRAEQLIAQEQVEGLADMDREWLARHLESCPDCAGMAGRTVAAVRALRGISVPLPPSLAERAQLRVYLRANEHRRVRHGWALWAAAAFSWALGLLMAPWVWRGFRWLGTIADLPDPVWKTAVIFWWAIPALLTVAVLLTERWGIQTGEERSDYVE